MVRPHLTQPGPLLLAQLPRRMTEFAPKRPIEVVADSAANEVRLLFCHSGYVGHRDYATDHSSLFGNLRSVVLLKR